MEFENLHKETDSKEVKKQVNRDPFVNIIMPVYNSEKTIEKSIKSVLQQTYQNFILIIVNDGSTDNTSNFLKKYSANNKIKVINQNNQGVSNARNVGLENANSDLVAFIDSDDYVLPNFLKNLVFGILMTKADLSVTGIIYRQNNVDKKSMYLESEDTNKEFISKLFDSAGPKGFLWNKLWNKNIIDKYNIRFDSTISIAEDLLFSIEYLVHVNKVKVLGTYDYVHVYEPNSLSAKMDINNRNLNYICPFQQYIMSLKKVISILETFDSNIVIYPETELTNACIALLRKIYFTNKNSEYPDLIRNIRFTAKHYHQSLFKNKKVNLTSKISYLLTLYMTPIMKIIDHIRYNK